MCRAATGDGPYARRVGSLFVGERLDRGEQRAFAVGVVAVVAALGALLLAATPAAQNGNPLVDVASRLWLVVCTTVVIVVVKSRVSGATKGVLVSVVAGAALMLGAALILNANDFAPLGYVLDQSHRTASITKFANNWGWVDFAYKGLPDSYPPLSFWILGRLAALFSIAPWKMLKVDVLATAFLVPVLTWPLWRRLVGRTAGLAALLASLLCFQAWYRPMAWLVVALFIPWWLWGVLGVGRDPARSRLELALAAVIGAALFCTYYFPFFVGALMLAVVAILRRPAAARGVALPPARPRDAGLVLGGTAVLSAPYWLPLVVSIVQHGYQSDSNRYYIPDFIDLRLRFLTVDLLGLVMLFGLGYLLVTARRSPVSLALLGLLVAALLYYVADYVGVLASLPILSFEGNELVDAILGAAAGIGLVHLWRLASSSEALRARLGRGGVNLISLVAGALVAFSLAQSAIKAIPFVSEQRQTEYPAALLADFRRAAGGQVENRVVLTDIVELPVFLPVYVFNWWDVQSPTTPAARVNDRTRFLDRLSHESEPLAFSLAVLHNGYDRIDDVVLRPNPGGGFQYTFTDDAFPRPPVQRTLTYPDAVFATAAFRRVNTSSFTLFAVERRHDPLAALSSCPGRPNARGCAVLDEVTRRFPGDLDAQLTDLAARWQAARRSPGAA